MLRIEISSDKPVETCLLRLWEDESREKLLSMDNIQIEEQEGIFLQVWETEYISPGHPGLVWYYFRLHIEERIYFYGNNQLELGGEGMLSSHEPPSYQITVYSTSPVPVWYKQGIMYQIFVDRFFRGNNGEVLQPKKKSLLHGDWTDTPLYIKDDKGRIIRWTFFGGNLQGVIEKLSYLEELGVNILYFNPIFEAASSHKYDTGDYHKIDPMFGDEATFIRLVQEAEKRGISIILDGVFSHTGSDSIYFNKYGNYPGLGAYQSEESPYYRWYRFRECEDEYECWWGVDDLPNVDELEPTYQEFICQGENSVVKHWMRRGVKGWRLDVVDELPDEFVKELRRTLKALDSEAVLIGEVWEDASRKVSYGQRREYFWGNELDAVMNYPLRSILVNFLLGTLSNQETYRRIMSLYENYPSENFRSAMNIIGSHDRVRILTLLGEAPGEEGLSALEKESFRLAENQRQLAVRRLKSLILLQMTLPGVPCIYYGDEAGLEGYSDPYNRGAYPWGKEDPDLLAWAKRMVKLRKEYDLFVNGEFIPFYDGEDIFGYLLQAPDEQIWVIVNRSLQATTMEMNELLDREGKAAVKTLKGNKLQNVNHIMPGNRLIIDLLDGKVVKESAPVAKEEPKLSLSLPPLEAKVLYVKRIADRSAISKERSCGILLHISSLPSSWRIGDLGKEARKFCDFLVSSGQRLWQILPLNPLGPGCSPYQSFSVLAGNTLLIDIDMLVEEGLLCEAEAKTELIEMLEQNQEAEDISRRLAATKKAKEKLFRKAYARFQTEMDKSSENPSAKNDSGSYISPKAFSMFKEENSFWLEDYCLYEVLRQLFPELPWYEWEHKLANREEERLNSIREQSKEELAYHRFLQYTFFWQWKNLRKYANMRGIKIVGDLPIYVSADSCDTWLQPRLFDLDEAGKPVKVAGVPPDYFSKTGQNWGNPLYHWSNMADEDYTWWKNRIRQGLGMYDIIRLDHFRGFEAYWEIPISEKTAVNGRWIKGPGKKLFERLHQEFGALPFIAEDLGHITPEVNNLRNIFSFPGMKVVQFIMNPKKLELEEEEELRNTVLYTGTHDNDTLVGWYLKEAESNLSAEEKKRIAEEIIEKVYRSEAPWVIIPLQDILALGSASRMNVPGTIEGNWGWRFKEDMLTTDIGGWLRELSYKSNRLPD